MSKVSDSRSWPAVAFEARAWRPKGRPSAKADRLLTSIDAAVPPRIAHLDYQLDSVQARASERALVAIARMDAVARSASPELTRFMIRTESVASSKIEQVSASAEDYARAISGSRANESASSMVAAAAAIGRMIDAAGQKGRIEIDDLLDAHRLLFVDDPRDRDHAGTVRREQNWLGGSDQSPLGALFVPPAPERVDSLLADLLDFSNRDDLPVLAQAAIAHAQFETIHPFVDGNGRIGRALIGAILRRRDVARHSIVPVASGLSARQGLYFDALSAYRGGDVGPVLALLSRASEAGGVEGLVSVDRIQALPADWANRVGARADSAAVKLLPFLFASPIMTAADMEATVGTSTPQVYAAIEQLEAAAVIHEITGRRRDRVWVASDLLDELDDLDRRIRALFNDADSKRVALDNIGRILRRSYELGVGSSVPQQLFTDGANFARVSTQGTMPERAGRIAQAAGLSWSAVHYSAGSTVTLAGLNRVLEALLVIDGRRPPRE